MMHLEPNKKQYEALSKLVEAGQVVCVVLEAMPTDSIAEQVELNSQIFDAEQLIPMGFFTDFSSAPKFKQMIDTAKAEGKRGFRVFGLTELAIMIFTKIGEKEPVN